MAQIKGRQIIKRLLGLKIRKVKAKAGQPISHDRPGRVSLDLSTHCQLKCVSCPTSNLQVRAGIGSGFLTFRNFKRFTLEHPWVRGIELSNWGEALLNPEFVEIIKWACRQGISTKLDNGVNLNSASDQVLEALVKYQVQSISCSIDGASQATYSMYRVNGNFGKVMENIARINEFKKKYNVDKPILTWQFVAFGHNESEIGLARAMAHDLGMRFHLKLSWDDLYGHAFSPVKNRELIKEESGLDAADRKEYEEKYGISYAANCCLNMWHSPNINFDGRLLGCCINYWDDFGNVFEEGLETCLKKERYKYTRDMLMGRKPEREDIPCVRCKIFMTRKAKGSFVTPAQLNS